jgi:succinyl-CoA synthetase alpha subunit
MGHAGAVISGGSGRAEDKIKALKNAGAAISPTPATMGETLATNLANHNDRLSLFIGFK